MKIAAPYAATGRPGVFHVTSARKIRFRGLSVISPQLLKEDKLKLNTFDRLVLLNILPREGDITILKIVRKLRENLSFSEAEHKALQFKQEDGQIKWRTEADSPKDVFLGEKATDIIVETLKSLSAQKKLLEEHLPLYEKAVL
jgi:hypothetical protein